jgi:hypothetical protein
LNIPLKYRLRKWLLRPSVRQLGLFISVGGALLCLSWVMKPSSPSDIDLLRNLRIASVIFFFTPIAIAIWVSRIPDPVPDFLAKISTRFFERDGLCFLFTVEEKESCARMVLYYQNRFDKPCTAKIFIGPTAKAFTNLKGFPTFEFNLSSQSAEFGKQSLAWSIPVHFQGKKVLWDMAVQVKYPSGRGALMRGRNGATVGDHIIGSGDQAVKAVTGVSAKSARVELMMPDKIIKVPTNSSGLMRETIWKLGDPIR